MENGRRWGGEITAVPAEIVTATAFPYISNFTCKANESSSFFQFYKKDFSNRKSFSFSLLTAFVWMPSTIFRQIFKSRWGIPDGYICKYVGRYVNGKGLAERKSGKGTSAKLLRCLGTGVFRPEV